MLVFTSHQPVVAPKKIVTGTRTRRATDLDILVPGSHGSFSRTIAKEVPSVKIQNKLSSSKIFSITFSYLGQLYHTRVLKVTYSGNQSLYKVALSTKIADHSSVCWLQYEPQGWAMLLGQELDERLKQAITIAIGCQEFYLNL